MKTLIIAEAGVNHNGDIEIAKKLVRAAAAAGADLIKFQSFLTEKSISKAAPKAEYQIQATGADESQYDMVKKLELSKDDHSILVAECARYGISFFSTAFDSDSLDMLMSFDLDYIKIPSGEITNMPLMRHMGSFGKRIILSTGMASLGDIEAAIEVLVLSGVSRNHITILHCTTEYPAPFNEVNLKAMVSIKSAFGLDVGYSDHTRGIEVSIAAVALGARVIEKHFTLSRGMEGPDHKASLEPEELKLLVSSIRNVEIALGDGVKKATDSEHKNKLIARKSLVAIKNIQVGDIFTSDNVGIKRPGTGISPMNWDKIIGRSASRYFKIDEQITWR